MAFNSLLAKTICALVVAGSFGHSLVLADETPARPELVLQLGHNGIVDALALSPDGQTLVSGSKDKTLRFWNLQNGELRRVVARPGTEVQALAFSPDGQTLASAAAGGITGQDKGELLLWDAHSEQLKLAFTEEDHNLSGTFSSIAFSPDGSTLAVARQPLVEDGGTVGLWDVRTGKMTRTFTASKGRIFKIAFSPDGNWLATAGADETVRVWNTATGTLKRSFKGVGKNQFGVAFSPDGTMLAGAGVESSEMEALTSIVVWDFAMGKTKKTLLQAGIVSGLCFLPDDQTLISGGGMLGIGEIRFWNLATGQSGKPIVGRSDFLFPLTVSADGQTFVTGGFAPAAKPEDLRTLDYFLGDLQVWDAKTRKLRRTMRGSHRPVADVAWSPDGKSLIEVGQEERGLPMPFGGDDFPAPDRGVDCWNAQSGTLKSIQTGKAPFAFSRDGRMRAFVDEQNQSEIQKFADEKGVVHSRALQIPHTVVALQDARTGRRLRTIPQNLAPQSLAFSPDGRTLAVENYKGESETTYQSQGVLMLYNTSTGKLKRSVNTSASVAGNGVAFSPNGSLVATGGSTPGEESGIVQLWNVATGKLARTLKASGPRMLSADAITDLAFAPDGKTLVGRSTFGLFWWNTQTGKQERALGTTGLIPEGDGPDASGKTPLAISPDGQTIATETSNRTIRLWDFKSGRLKHELSGHIGAVWSLAFSPDSGSLASGSWDGTTKIWRVSTGELRATLIRLPRFGADKKTTPDWIAFSPDGHYSASPGASALVRWRVGNALLPAQTVPAQESFDLLATRAPG